MKKYFYIIAMLNLMYTSKISAMEDANAYYNDPELQRTYEEEKNNTWDLRRDLHSLRKIIKHAELTLDKKQYKKLEWHHGAVETALKETIQKYEEARQAILEKNYNNMEKNLKIAESHLIKARKELLDYKNNIKEVLRVDIDSSQPQAKL